MLIAPGFVDSPWEALPHWEEWLGVGLGVWKEGREGEPWLVCKMNKKLKKKLTHVSRNQRNCWFLCVESDLHSEEILGVEKNRS